MSVLKSAQKESKNTKKKMEVSFGVEKGEGGKGGGAKGERQTERKTLFDIIQRKARDTDLIKYLNRVIRDLFLASCKSVVQKWLGIWVA